MNRTMTIRLIENDNEKLSLEFEKNGEWSLDLDSDDNLARAIKCVGEAIDKTFSDVGAVTYYDINGNQL